jgi:predicted nucleotide-binding protein
MTVAIELKELNEALLDFQRADHDTYQRPLQRMVEALHSEDLRPFTDQLKGGQDLDAFLTASGRQPGMGNDRLVWPTKRNEELGLIILIIERGAENPSWFLNFAHQYFSASGPKIVLTLRKVLNSLLLPFARGYVRYVEAQNSSPALPTARPEEQGNRVFIVHGHDEAPKEAVARFLEKLRLDPIILHEQANRGMSIPEKLAAHSAVGFAVVLLTPDDVGRAVSEAEVRPRARQNVWLELGYFIGLLGRDRVIALKKDDIDIPSDYVGVGYTSFDRAGAWKQELARELEAGGYDIDWNTVMRS